MDLSFSHIMHRFHHAIRWNLALYVAYRILFTALSFILYSHLSSTDFSLWANINSLTFLILLWTDCGLRKSIPHFAPQFTNASESNLFISRIFLCQILLVLIGIPLFIYTLSHLNSNLAAQLTTPLLIAACIAFIMEGITNHLRNLYHSHFRNKQYNLIFTGTLIIEMIGTLCLVQLSSPNMLLIQITIVRIISRIVMISICIHYGIKRNNHDTIQHNPRAQHNQPTLKIIAKHSALMWITSLIKSLSERNFIVPLLTHTIGVHDANIFKVVNDAALFFYRVIPKTIGSTDTLILTHAESSTDRKTLLPLAFTELTTKIASISIPLMGVLIVFMGTQDPAFFHSKMTYLFAAIVVGYAIEQLFSPYERILEIKRDYASILLAYIPYILLIVASYYYKTHTAVLDLIVLIVFIHAVRLTSIFFMVRTARKQYGIQFPTETIWRNTKKYIPWYCACFIIIHYSSLGTTINKGLALILRG